MTINCRGRLINFEEPKIMGILNITPDSFYDGGRYKSEKTILARVEKMLVDGATFIDVGGQSTRPGAEFLTPDQESQRVVPIVELVHQEFPEAIISVDTFHATVAEKTVQAGAALINDISAGSLDAKMMQTVAKLQVPYIMMHMRGTPKTMQSMTDYDDMMQQILYYFSEKITEASALGINDLIIDPGFGFSKTIAQNFTLLRETELFKVLELPILLGVSRKSTICKSLNISPDQALNGTTVLNTLSLLKGGDILRVHDVREAWECVQLVKQFTA